MGLQKEYDYIVSLGPNCETSFRIQDNFEKFESFPLSWTAVTKIEKLPEIIRDPRCLLNGDITYWGHGLVYFKNTDCAFHLKYPLAEEKQINDLCLKTDESIIELLSRLNHLVNKNLDLYNSENKTLFIIKCNLSKLETCIWDIMLALKESYKSKKYDVLIVGEGDNEPINCWNGFLNCYVRFVKKYAADDNTQNGGDHDGWHKIFNEFCSNIKS